ncbi:MAG: putative metallopeptidase [Phycisphaeraceae bacterium]
MAEIWQAPEEIRKQLQLIKDEYHTHLAPASMWVICSDGAAIRDNQLVATQTKKCTKSEKLSTGHDFKIVILMETWAKLTDDQRHLALDEALCRCGVRMVPETVEINGRREVLKDDLGRVIFTDEMDVDKLGNPKWKVNRPDAELYFKMLARKGTYNEQAENTVRALEGKPLKLPLAADRADVTDEQLDEQLAM